MEYTVNQLAKLAGVSGRTLRFYDQIGLLTPARENDSGYRLYSSAEVDQLQQILFYRELGFALSDIKKALHDKSFDRVAALSMHREALEGRRDRLNLLIDTINRTIDMEKGGNTMADHEKFTGFKQKLIDENERKYGAEIREKYGDDTIDASNQKLMNMTQEQYDEMETLNKVILEKLSQAVSQGLSATSEEGKEIAMLHKRWIGFHWKEYSAEAHKGLAQMYVDDTRFTAYFDDAKPGRAQFLRDAIHHWVGRI